MKRLLHIGFTLIMLMAFMASSPALLQLSFAARGDDSSEVGNSNNDNSQSSYLSQNNACRSLYGSGFYYAPKQNACLPPSGSGSRSSGTEDSDGSKAG